MYYCVDLHPIQLYELFTMLTHFPNRNLDNYSRITYIPKCKNYKSLFSAVLEFNLFRVVKQFYQCLL